MPDIASPDDLPDDLVAEQAAASPVPSPMSPGTYLRKRREAGNISLATLASAMFPGANVSSQAAVRELLAEVEANRATIDSRFSASIARHLHMDSEIFDRLTAIHHGCDLPVPQICRQCACSWNDACLSPAGPCAWSRQDSNICTRCETENAA